MTRYQIYTHAFGSQSICDTDRNCWIPFDEANIDYQVYLAWVAEGNTAEQWTPEVSETEGE